MFGWGMGATMCAMAIRDDNSPEELRRRARQEMTAGLPLVCSRLPSPGRDGPRKRGATGRHGPADLARLGSSLQRRGDL
jgi:hypothetical protein